MTDRPRSFTQGEVGDERPHVLPATDHGRGQTADHPGVHGGLGPGVVPVAEAEGEASDVRDVFIGVSILRDRIEGRVALVPLCLEQRRAPHEREYLLGELLVELPARGRWCVVRLDDFEPAVTDAAGAVHSIRESRESFVEGSELLGELVRLGDHDADLDRRGRDPGLGLAVDRRLRRLAAGPDRLSGRLGLTTGPTTGAPLPAPSARSAASRTPGSSARRATARPDGAGAPGLQAFASALPASLLASLDLSGLAELAAPLPPDRETTASPRRWPDSCRGRGIVVLAGCVGDECADPHTSDDHPDRDGADELGVFLYPAEPPT